MPTQPSLARHRRPTRWTGGGAPALVALLVLLPLLVLWGARAAVAGPATNGPTDPVATASASPDPTASASATAHPLVILGMSGVTWTDVSAESTPALWSLGVADAVGNLVVRSLRATTCPADGWLALSAGARAADLPSDERTTDGSGLACRPLTEAVDGVVPGWADYLTTARDSSYAGRLGLFGTELAASDTSSVAIGPGAAIALADAAGDVTGDALPLPTDPGDVTAVVSDAVATHDVVVIDVGSVRDWVAPEVPEGSDPPTPPDRDVWRAEQIAQVEARVAAALAGVAEAEATSASTSGETSGEPLLVVASLADSGGTPAMQLLATRGLGPGTLATHSTRQVGYVQSTDLTPWFLRELGLTAGLSSSTSAALVGSPPYVVSGPGTAEAGAARVAALVDAELHAQAQRPIIAPFYLVLVILNVALYAGVALGLSRPAASRAGVSLSRLLRLDSGRLALSAVRPRVLRGLRAVAIAMAAIPVSTFLANLVPWWRAAEPALGFVGVTAVIVALVTAVALTPPWRRRILGPLGLVAGLTAVVLAVDVATGAHLQISAVMGVPVLVAGRFYGFNNTAFALFTTASILLVVAVTNPLVVRGRRRLAGVIVAVVGLVVTALDGAPSIGADFGGPPAILPAFALLALMAAGVRITWRRVVAVLGAAVVATLGLAVLDYLRPPDERTHLGGFIATLLDGGAWSVVARKLEANLRILANNRPLTILALAGVALVVFVLARPVSKAITSPGGGRFAWLSSGAPISQMGDVTPMLRPGLVALAVALGIGFAVNDSGIAIPAYGVALAVPLLLAACSSWMLTLDGSTARPRDGASHAVEQGDGEGRPQRT